jgi:hypothetical protein
MGIDVRGIGNEREKGEQQEIRAMIRRRLGVRRGDRQKGIVIRERRRMWCERKRRKIRNEKRVREGNKE